MDINTKVFQMQIEDSSMIQGISPPLYFVPLQIFLKWIDSKSFQALIIYVIASETDVHFCLCLTTLCFRKYFLKHSFKFYCSWWWLYLQHDSLIQQILVEILICARYFSRVLLLSTNSFKRTVMRSDVK